MFGNPVLGPRIVPFAEARLSTDYLPNGHPGFRVTQRFADWDTFFRDRLHGAIDVANFTCGDAVVAAADGYILPIRDPNGALGAEIQHPTGYRTQYWHLDGTPGTGTIKRGQTVGRVGKTGLTIAGCHLHFVVQNAAGVAVDPWPLLDQNIVVPPPSTIVPWHATMRCIGYPFIRDTAGGTIVGKASVGQLFTSWRIQKAGPTYVDPRNGKTRRDWVEVTFRGGKDWIAKSFLVTVKKL